MMNSFPSPSNKAPSAGLPSPAGDAPLPEGQAPVIGDLDAGRADPGDGIVDRANNRSIMGQHDIGDRPEPLDSLAIVDAQRLVREVSARTDQGARGVAEQEMMQW